MQLKLEGCSWPSPDRQDRQTSHLRLWSTPRWQSLPVMNWSAPSLPSLFTPHSAGPWLTGRWINGSVGCPCSQNPLPSNARGDIYHSATELSPARYLIPLPLPRTWLERADSNLGLHVSMNRPPSLGPGDPVSHSLCVPEPVLGLSGPVGLHL